MTSCFDRPGQLQVIHNTYNINEMMLAIRNELKRRKIYFLHKVCNYIKVYIVVINFEVVCIAAVLKFCVFNIGNKNVVVIDGFFQHNL